MDQSDLTLQAKNDTKTSNTGSPEMPDDVQRCPWCKRTHDGYSRSKPTLCDSCSLIADRRRAWADADAETLLDLCERIGVGRRFCVGGKPPSMDDDGLRGRDRPSGGLFITGIVGSHKTHLMAARTVCAAKRGHTAHLLKWDSFALEVRDTFKQTVGGDSEQDVLHRYAKLDYLGIDDLGIGRLDDIEKPAALRLAYSLIDSRYDSCKTTDVTTNWTPTELAKRFDERIARRLAEMTKVYSMSQA